MNTYVSCSAIISVNWGSTDTPSIYIDLSRKSTILERKTGFKSIRKKAIFFCESPLITIINTNRWSNSIEGYEILCRRLNSRENHRVFLRLNPVLCPVFGNRWMLRSRDFLYSYFLFQIISESNSRK